MKASGKILNFILVLCALAYPLVVYFGLLHFNLRAVTLVLGLLLILRSFVASSRFTTKLNFVTRIVGLLLIVSFLFQGGPDLLKLYPLAINLTLFAVFSLSLRSEQTPMIERFARLASKEPLGPEAIVYVRRVTIVWCGFFLINSAISFYTIFFSDLATWTLYNGLISYLIIALIFAIELPYRIYLKRKWKQ